MKIIIVSISLFLMFSDVYSYKYNSLLFLKKSIAGINDTSEYCTLTTISKSKYTDVYIYGLSDSSVKFSNDEYVKEILIKDIKTITFKGSGFWKGAAIGGGIGLITGLLLGASLAEMCDGVDNCKSSTTISGGFIVGVPFALIGGGLGILFADDKVYDLSKLDIEAKRKKVRYLIIKFSDR